MRGSAPSRKLPLTLADLQNLLNISGASSDFDNQLFLAITFIGLHGLLRLGEFTTHDNPAHRSMQKAIKRHSITFHNDPQHLSFTLPMHKADQLYEGSKVVIEQRKLVLDPIAIFCRYLHTQDLHDRWHPLLWLREDGSSPTHAWYIRQLHRHFRKDITGHSLRSGGVTALALANTPTSN